VEQNSFIYSDSIWGFDHQSIISDKGNSGKGCLQNQTSKHK